MGKTMITRTETLGYIGRNDPTARDAKVDYYTGKSSINKPSIFRPLPKDHPALQKKEKYDRYDQWDRKHGRRR